MKPIRHQRSRTRLLIENALFLAVVVPFGLLMAYLFGFQAFTNWFIGAICVLNLLLGGHTLFELWRQDGGFLSELDDEAIRCHCPAPSMGNTFDIPLSELREIVVHTNRSKIVLVDSSANRWWLTFNFGNPAWKLVEGIRKRCPGLKSFEE